MKELLRTNDMIELSWTEAVLSEHGIECIILDAHMSVMEGSIGAIPRRVMVANDMLARAKALLESEKASLSHTQTTTPTDTGNRR